MRTPLALKPPVSENLLILDGISRSGKKLACKILSCLDKVEYFQYLSIIENTAYLQLLGHLETETAARFLQLAVDEAIYNRAIGRNLNTRESDDTSITKAHDPDEYHHRSTASDGATAMEVFNAEGRMALFYNHSVLSMSDILFEAFPFLKLVHITRHPIDIAEDWLRRGWGQRWGEDSLAFNVIAKKETGTVPWFAVDWAEQYLEMTPAERCVEAVVRLQKTDVIKLHSLDEYKKKQTHQVTFENLITRPHDVIAELSSFVGRKPHDGMAALLTSENCPAPLPLENRRENLEKLQAESAGEVIARLLDASEAYEKAWGLDPIA